MKKLDNTRRLRRLLIAAVAVGAVGSASALTSAHSASTSISIANHSHRTVRNVYLSHVDADDWGNDQLPDGSSIAPNQSQSITVSWDQQQVKVIAEDDGGCFLTAVVSATANATWTITDDTPADCGGSQ